MRCRVNLTTEQRQMVRDAIDEASDALPTIRLSTYNAFDDDCLVELSAAQRDVALDAMEFAWQRILAQCVRTRVGDRPEGRPPSQPGLRSITRCRCCSRARVHQQPIERFACQRT